MARLPRLSVPDFPHHVIQRGNNRQPIFIDTRDYETFLSLLDEYTGRERVALHSYVLMGNHFHLLLTPASSEALPRLMQGVGRRYVRLFNQRHQRSGTLWEGRYRSAPVQTERYLLACMAYIDLNPVRAGLASRPEDYPWSSHAHYLGLRTERRITPHPIYWQLGNTPFEREARYREWVAQRQDADLQARLAEAALKGWALGDADYIASLQLRTPRRVSRAARGRPRVRPSR